MTEEQTIRWLQERTGTTVYISKLKIYLRLCDQRNGKFTVVDAKTISQCVVKARKLLGET